MPDNELTEMDKERKQDELTIESFGEMFVTWRLKKGLLSSEEGETPIVITTLGNERTISADDFAREVGGIMMPYLSTHPDLGFEEFRKNIFKISKIGIVSYHEGVLTNDYPYSQIIEEYEKACKQFGHQPTVMLVYIKFSKDQKIQLLQYAHLKARIYMCYGVKHLSINIAHGKGSSQEINKNEGSIQIWIA